MAAALRADGSGDGPLPSLASTALHRPARGIDLPVLAQYFAAWDRRVHGNLARSTRLASLAMHPVVERRSFGERN